MKNNKSLNALIGIIGMFLFLACSDSVVDNSVQADQLENEFLNKTVLDSSIVLMPFEQPSDVEKEGLTYMREEEKVARDIYKKMYEKWGVRAFNNIQSSEQQHMNALKYLLSKYQIPDPVSNDAVGVFTNTKLQNLYNELLPKGSVSINDALSVGALIEEVDIADLQNEIKILTGEKEDINFVYNNLIKGSANHLRAFVRNLSARGIVYKPQLLSSDIYNQIMSGQL